MGFWGRVREWLDGGPERVPDVASFDDARLTELWNERTELTDAAREAVRAERERRGLGARGLTPHANDDGATAPVEATQRDLPAPSGNLISVQPGPFVFLQTVPGRAALLLLPRWSPDPVDLPTELALDALVVCNHEPRGWLDASRILHEGGLSPEQIYATEAGAIDRTPGEANGEATLLPDTLTLGNLTLRRMKGLDTVLRAIWRKSPLTAAIGPMLPNELVTANPASKVYVGSLAEPGRDPAWGALLAAAHASAMTSVVPGLPKMEGPTVILAGDAVGTTLRRHTHVLPGLGITVVGEECPVAPDAVALLGNVRAGRVGLTDDATSGQIEDVMEHLVVESRLDDASQLVAHALSRRADDPTLHRLDATLRALEGDAERAIVSLARAERDAHSGLVAAAVCSARGDHDAAERAARTTLERLPNDADALAALVRCLWLARRVDDARRVVDDAPAFSLTGTQASDLYSLVDRDPPDEPPTEPGLAHLATRALAVARRASDRDRALRAYRRALELDPFCAAAADALTSLEAEDASE